MTTRGWIAVIAWLSWSSALALGNVNLELRPVNQTIPVGQVLEVGLYAVSDSATDQMVRGMQVILQWDPAHLALDVQQPLVNNGPYPWLMSGFFNDAGGDGLNNTFADGNAYYQAAGNFQAPAWATPQGLLVTTLRFIALAQAPATTISIPPLFGQHTLTQVFGEVSGEVNVVGTLGSAVVAVGWGRLTLEMPGVCAVLPGQTVTIELRVSQLPQAINGVQALVGYPEGVMTFVGAFNGDGLGSPWDAAVEVYESASSGVLTYAVILFGGESDEDAVVARLMFQYGPDSAPALGSAELLAQHAPLITKLSEADNGTPQIPELGPAQIISTLGDMDASGRIDATDLAGFLPCLDGPGAAFPPGNCCRADFDRDLDVDLVDFASFQRVFTGP